MKISKTHQRFADRLGNQRALEYPEEFLGQNWKDVLNFWFFMDTLTEEQIKSISDAYFSLSSDERHFAYLADSDAAQVATGYSAARLAARDAAFDAAWYAAWDAAGYATYELICSHIFKEKGKSLVFLPLFLNV
jgi:hypothetical protein